MPYGRAGLPEAMTYGGMSCSTIVPMPVMLCAPMRQNWCTTVKPPRIASSPTSHVAGELRVVREHGVVADLAVVRDVDVGHDPVVVADARDAARPARCRG